MTDLPKPSPQGPADAAAADTTSPEGDPELASLVFGGSRTPKSDDGDPSLAALVRLGQRPVSAAVPAAAMPTPATPATTDATQVAAGPDGLAPVASVAVAAGGPGMPEPASIVASDASAAEPTPPTAPAAIESGDAAPSETAHPETDATEPVPDSASVDGDAAPAATPSPASVTAPDADTAPTLPEADAEPGPPLAAAVVAASAVEAWEPPVPRRGRSLALRFAFAFIFGVLLVVGAGAGALYAWGQQYEGRVLPGVRVGSTDLSGLTREQAQAAIASAYSSLGDGKITLTGPDGPVTIAYSDIARGPDTSAILDAALAAGRGGEPLAQLIGAPQAALHGVTVASAVTYDRAKLAAAIDGLANTIDQPAIDAVVTSDPTGGYTVSPAKDGRAVDRNALLAALDQKLTALDSPADIALDVSVLTVKPAVDTTVADAAKAAADRMTADLVIVRGADSWTVPSAKLRPLVTFVQGSDGSISPTFDESGLDPILKTLAKSVNQSPKEAGLRLVGNHVVATGKSREGRTLLVPAMKTAMIAQVAARQAGTAVEPLQAQVKAVQPKLSSETANKYASKMVPISKYSVFYYVIVNNHWGGNIEGPANQINGAVVPAGTVFDFWKVVGDLHNVAGVGPGNAIEGGKITVTGAFGGGICTTSTTLFNAAFRAGMVPMARQNHNEFISRYPPGLDATVWIVGSAKQTMSFKNDTKYPILIQRTITRAGGIRWLTFKIWSVPNGRTYKISNLVIQNGPRAIDTIVKDPTKPVGYTYRNNAPADGAKVWVTVSIFDHGKLHWSKRYYSNYPAVNGVLVVGTKAAL